MSQGASGPSQQILSEPYWDYRLVSKFASGQSLPTSSFRCPWRQFQQTNCFCRHRYWALELCPCWWRLFSAPSSSLYQLHYYWGPMCVSYGCGRTNQLPLKLRYYRVTKYCSCAGADLRKRSDCSIVIRSFENFVCSLLGVSWPPCSASLLSRSISLVELDLRLLLSQGAVSSR